jgi:elongation factor 1-gamma
MVMSSANALQSPSTVSSPYDTCSSSTQLGRYDEVIFNQLSLSENIVLISIHTLSTFRFYFLYVIFWTRYMLILPVTSQNEKTTLLGKTKQDYASILKWMSFANSELIGKLSDWIFPLRGIGHYNKKNVEEAQKETNNRIKVLEDYLLVNTYLVGERLSLADVFVASLLIRGFQYVFDKKWRADFPCTTRWYETITNQPIYESGLKTSFIDEAIKYTPPKKEAAPKKETPKAAPKAAAKKDDDDEEEDKPAPKPKHPLDALPRSTMVLDDWKRKYSNEDTPVAMKWFWETANFDEYSLWRVDYKYNDELTLTFMSSNLIGKHGHVGKG